MMRALICLAVLCSCTQPQVTWPTSPTTRAMSPLVLTPLDARAPAPSVAEFARPPRFPTVGERRLPGAKLWLVEQPHMRSATIRVVTRRGHDGAYDEANMHAMVATVGHMLQDRLPGYRIRQVVNAYNVSLEVVVRPEDVAATLRSMGEVLDGPIDETVARLHLSRSHHSLDPWDPVRPQLFRLPSEPLVFNEPIALEQCRDERFSSSDRLVSIVGEFDQTAVIAAATEVFATDRTLPRAAADAPVLIQPERVAESRIGNAFSIALVLAAPESRHRDDDAFDLLLTLTEEPLEMRQAEHTGVVPPVLRTSGDNVRPGLLAFLEVEAAAANAEYVIEALFRSVRGLITRPFTPRAVDRGRRRYWMNIQNKLDDDPTSFLAVAFIRHLVPSQLEARYRALETLTPEDLLAISRRYLVPARMMVLVEGPRPVLSRLTVVRNRNGFRLRVDPPPAY